MTSLLNRSYYGISFRPLTTRCADLKLVGLTVIKNVQCTKCNSVGFWVGLRSLCASQVVEFTGAMFSQSSILAPTIRINYDIGFKSNIISGKNITIRPVKDRIEKDNIVTKIVSLFARGKYREYFSKGQAYIHNIQGEDVYLENCVVETLIAERVFVYGNCEIKQCNAQSIIRMEQ